MEIPRDLQSDLHDKADEFAEQIAEGKLIALRAKLNRVEGGPEEPYLRSYEECTCSRYSEKKPDGTVYFWAEADPDCRYVHLAPLSSIAYTVPV